MSASSLPSDRLPRYDRFRSYEWNREHAPDPVDIEVPSVPGTWDFCGLPIESPLGIPAGPLLNGRWCLYYASLGFDVLTYKTVRRCAHPCYEMPNLQPVECGQVDEQTGELAASEKMQGTWAVSFGMPSADPDIWRADVEQTRRMLPDRKVLVVSVVATVESGQGTEELARDYAACARWAVDSGADAVEANFSCPNVCTPDGQLYQDAEAAAGVAAAVRDAIGGVPFIVKIGHVASVEAAGALLQAVGPFVDTVSMTNSVATHVRHSGQLLFGGQKRGICGAGILEASVRQLRLFAGLEQKGFGPVRFIAVGGIRTADDVRRCLEAGAVMCQMATAAMVSPDVAIRIRRELALQQG